MQNGTGVELRDGVARFQVWASKPEKVELVLPGGDGRQERCIPMEQSETFWCVDVEDVDEGTRYLYRLDGKVDRPDPASRLQPEGVHKASQVVDTNFQWTDKCWFGLPLKHHVIYELHVGTFTAEGTFDAVIPHLQGLRDLGVTAIELMPVAQFPGVRNWGYDGTYLFAVQHSYGGPGALARLVDAAHNAGIAVIMDVVYNHLGPEGNYLAEFGHYFTDDFRTPWGPAVNFGGEHSDQVREFFLNNATHWIRDFHIDGLRLDASHLILDPSAFHFLEELKRHTDNLAEELNRQVHLFAESDANDPRYVASPEANGYGLDCQWLDDYHHSLYTLLNGAGCDRYIEDYFSTRHFAKAYRDGFVYSGEYCPTRKHKHGRSSQGLHGKKFVVFIQNHDQVGNKPAGTRLATELSFEGQKLAAAAYILSPYIPLLFMGEEYGETRPFLFFTDHSDEDLIEKMREGRKEEFGRDANADQLRDPQAIDTFTDSVLAHVGADETAGEVLRNFYKAIIGLRRRSPALSNMDKNRLRAYHGQNHVTVERHHEDEQCVIFMNFGLSEVELFFPLQGDWTCVLDSADEHWGGSGGLAPEALQISEKCESAVRVRPESLVVYSWPLRQ
jgi:maltooligosyltrehalose trehalohydrolase